MTSNILSRFLPPNGSPSVYETIRHHDATSDSSDVEERAGLTLEDGPGEHYSDRELEDAMADAERSRLLDPDDAFISRKSPRKASVAGPSKSNSRHHHSSRPRWAQDASPGHDFEDGDDDVPASLLVEGHHDDDDLKSRLPPPPTSHLSPDDRQPSLPGPSTRGDRARGRAAREQQPLHHADRRRAPAVRWSLGLPNLNTVDPKEKAMWMWANVENLDNFLKDVYTYFLGNGIWSILLNRVLSLL
jgi:autophagy-related protein 9